MTTTTELIRNDNEVTIMWEKEELAIRPKAMKGLTIKVDKNCNITWGQSYSTVHGREDFNLYLGWIDECLKIIQTQVPSAKPKKISARNLRPNTLYLTSKGQAILYAGPGKFREDQYVNGHLLEGSNRLNTQYTWARFDDASRVTSEVVEDRIVLRYPDYALGLDTYVTKPNDCIEVIAEFPADINRYEIVTDSNQRSHYYDVISHSNNNAWLAEPLSLSELKQMYDEIPQEFKNPNDAKYWAYYRYLTETKELSDEQRNAARAALEEYKNHFFIPDDTDSEEGSSTRKVSSFDW